MNTAVEHGMKVLERRLREKVSTEGMQFGLISGKGMTIFKVK